MESRKLCKSRSDKKISGVCGGLAAYLNLDSSLIRVIWIILGCMGGSGLLAYILCAVIMPEETNIDSNDFHNEN